MPADLRLWKRARRKFRPLSPLRRPAAGEDLGRFADRAAVGFAFQPPALSADQSSAGGESLARGREWPAWRAPISRSRRRRSTGCWKTSSPASLRLLCRRFKTGWGGYRKGVSLMARVAAESWADRRSREAGVIDRRLFRSRRTAPCASAKDAAQRVAEFARMSRRLALRNPSYRLWPFGYGSRTHQLQRSIRPLIAAAPPVIIALAKIAESAAQKNRGFLLAGTRTLSIGCPNKVPLASSFVRRPTAVESVSGQTASRL